MQKPEGITRVWKDVMGAGNGKTGRLPRMQPDFQSQLHRPGKGSQVCEMLASVVTQHRELTFLTTLGCRSRPTGNKKKPKQPGFPLV